MFQHQTILENLRLDSPDSHRDFQNASQTSVSAEDFLFFHLEAAERAVENQADRLRQLLGQDIPVFPQFPQPAAAHHLIQSSTAGKCIFARLQTAFPSRKDNAFQAAAVLESMGVHQSMVIQADFFQHVAVLKCVASDFYSHLKIKVFQLPAAAETGISHCGNLSTDTFPQVLTALKKPFFQGGKPGDFCPLQGQAACEGACAQTVGAETDFLDSGAFFKGTRAHGTGR